MSKVRADEVVRIASVMVSKKRLFIIFHELLSWMSCLAAHLILLEASFGLSSQAQVHTDPL